MPSTAAETMPALSERPAVPTPIATIDSPSAMMTTSPWRSAKCAGETRQRPLRVSGRGLPSAVAEGPGLTSCPSGRRAPRGRGARFLRGQNQRVSRTRLDQAICTATEHRNGRRCTSSLSLPSAGHPCREPVSFVRPATSAVNKIAVLQAIHLQLGPRDWATTRPIAPHRTTLAFFWRVARLSESQERVTLSSNHLPRSSRRSADHHVSLVRWVPARAHRDRGGRRRSLREL
jgi:hypothetical protein